MAGYLKKLGVILILLVLLPVLSSCDGLQDEAEIEYNYLNISADNQYGVEQIEPDLGRYRYEDGAVVEIEFAEAAGYEFLGWEGDDGGDVAGSDGDYSIQLDGDKNIRAALRLKEFKPLEIDFSGIEPIDYVDADDITGVPHNFEDVTIFFNNALYPDNELEVRIEKVNDNANDNDNDNSDNDQDEDIIEANNILIDDNKIEISLTDWRDRFFTDESQDEYLEFAEEYQLIVETPYDDYIIDVDNREYQNDEIVVDFMVEEPYPETPENVRIERKGDDYEISWQRSRANAQIDVDEYVKEYRLYKFTGESDFTEDDADEEIEIDVDNPDDKKVIRYEGEIQDTENIYYRVKAINEYDNDSGLSETVELD